MKKHYYSFMASFYMKRFIKAVHDDKNTDKICKRFCYYDQKLKGMKANEI